MKPSFALKFAILFALSALPSFALPTNTVTFTFQDIISVGYSNRSVTFTPLSTPLTNAPAVVVSQPITKLTDSHGVLVLTNIHPGSYKAAVLGSSSATSFNFTVPTNQGALIGWTLLTTTNISDSSVSGYTKSQANGLFVSRAGTNVTLRTNGGWVYIDAAGGTNSSSGTNSGNYVTRTNGYATNLNVNGLLVYSGVGISNAIVSGAGAAGSASADGAQGTPSLILSGIGGDGGSADSGSNGDGGNGGQGGALMIKGGAGGGGGSGDGSGNNGTQGDGGPITISGGAGPTYGNLNLQTINGSTLIGNTNGSSRVTLYGALAVGRTTTNGHVATVDGSGGITFQPPSGGGTNRYAFVVATNYADIQTAASSNSHAFRLGEANLYSNALSLLNIPGEFTLFATFDGTNGVGSNLVQQPNIGTFAGIFGENGALGGSANFLLRTNGKISLAKGSNTQQTLYYFMQSSSTNPIKRVVANFDAERATGTNYPPQMGLIISSNGGSYNSAGFGSVAHVMWQPQYESLSCSFYTNGFGNGLLGTCTLSWDFTENYGTNQTVEYSIDGNDVWGCYRGVWKKATVSGLSGLTFGNYLCVEYFDIANWSSNNAPGRWFLDSVAASPNAVVPANAGNFLASTNGTAKDPTFSGNVAISGTNTAQQFVANSGITAPAGYQFNGASGGLFQQGPSGSTFAQGSAYLDSASFKWGVDATAGTLLPGSTNQSIGNAGRPVSSITIDGTIFSGTGSNQLRITSNLVINARVVYSLTNLDGIARTPLLPLVFLTNSAYGGFTAQETNTLSFSTLSLSNAFTFFAATATGTNLAIGFYDQTNIVSTNGFSNNATVGNVAQTNFFNSLAISNRYLVAQATTNGGSTLTNYFTNNNQLRLVGGLVLTNIDNNFTNRSRSNLGNAYLEMNVPVSAKTNPVVSVWTNSTLQMAIRGDGSILLPNTAGTRSLEFQNPGTGTLYIAPTSTDVLGVYSYDVLMASFASGFINAQYNAGVTGFGFLNSLTGFYSPVSGGAGTISVRTNLSLIGNVAPTNGMRLTGNFTTNAFTPLTNLFSYVGATNIGTTNFPAFWDGNSNNVVLTGTTNGTVGSTGTASALPALPAGYIVIYVNGTQVKIPYYAP